MVRVLHCTTHEIWQIDRGQGRYRRRMNWETRRLPAAFDALAPDGSEIRAIGRVHGASMVHCTLPPNEVTQAVRHRTVEEVWYCVAGRGELWRRSAQVEEVTPLEPGVGVTLLLGVEFQFRSIGAAPLVLVIATAPPWPGADEAVAVTGRWAR
jgi:mannose-6-phosphate isomerase-like protein (cupin superfamily)